MEWIVARSAADGFAVHDICYTGSRQEAVEAAVIAYALEQPAHGLLRASNELRQRGIFVSGSWVRSIWLRHNLASFKQRLAQLEAQVAQTGAVLTEAQVAALERKKWQGRDA